MRKILSIIMLVVFIANTSMPLGWADIVGDPVSPLQTPPPVVYTPPHLMGLKIEPQKPFRFNFIIDKGISKLQGEDLRIESEKLIRYFLASLTINEKDMWVNLSPDEPNRIIPKVFGETEMGRDLLAQDLQLKKLAANVIGNVLEQKSNLDELSRVWIVPEKAVVYEHNNSVVVLEAHLKVMMQEDYVASSQNDKKVNPLSDENRTLLTKIEADVNQGQDFAPLRQIYYSMILATWYKNKLKGSILN